MVAGLAILHYFWMCADKSDFAAVPLYAAGLLKLLGWRVLKVIDKKRLRPSNNINSLL